MQATTTTHDLFVRHRVALIHHTVTDSQLSRSARRDARRRFIHAYRSASRLSLTPALGPASTAMQAPSSALPPSVPPPSYPASVGASTAGTTDPNYAGAAPVAHRAGPAPPSRPHAAQRYVGDWQTNCLGVCFYDPALCLYAEASGECAHSAVVRRRSSRPLTVRSPARCLPAVRSSAACPACWSVSALS